MLAVVIPTGTETASSPTNVGREEKSPGKKSPRFPSRINQELFIHPTFFLLRGGEKKAE